jgi:hypothetical protein
MKLLSLDIVDFYSTLDELIVTINQHASKQKYAVIKKRMKKSKKEILRKAVLRCDKDKIAKSQEFNKRETSTRLCECSFETIVTLSIWDWQLNVKDVSHNHVSTSQESHLILRKMTLTSKIRQQIVTQTLTKTLSQQILTNLRTIDDEKNAFFKIKDLYNQRQIMRHKSLRNLTATQTLMNELSVRKHWFVRHYLETESLERLFFARDNC